VVDEPPGDQAVAPSSDSPGSRRALLTAGVAGAAAALISACSGSGPLRQQVRRSAKVSRKDVPTLNRLLDVEHNAVEGYAAGIPLLHGDVEKTAQRLLAQELAHTVQLSDLILGAGGKPVRPRASYDLGNPRDAHQVLAMVKRLEQEQLSAYLDAIPRLSTGGVRSAVAAIYANDAQHLAMLRWQTGEFPVPHALATGR
jgi:hypothetical protein